MGLHRGKNGKKKFDDALIIKVLTDCCRIDRNWTSLYISRAFLTHQGPVASVDISMHIKKGRGIGVWRTGAGRICNWRFWSWVLSVILGAVAYSWEGREVLRYTLEAGLTAFYVWHKRMKDVAGGGENQFIWEMTYQKFVLSCLSVLDGPVEYFHTSLGIRPGNSLAWCLNH